MTQYYLYNTFTGTANAGAQIQIIQKGRIIGVQWCVTADLDADGEYFAVELSLVPIYQSDTNDSKGIISNIRQLAAVGAAGTAVSGTNLFVPVDVPVGAGQLLYLNGGLSGTQAVKTSCIVSVR